MQPRKKKNDPMLQKDSPADSPLFEDIVLESAREFKDWHEVAKHVFRMPDADFSRACFQHFNMSADDLYSWCATMSDIRVRSRLRALSSEGNATALAIYTKYVDRLQKDQTDATLRVAIVPLPSDSGSDPDSDQDDGGVHLGGDR